jgi:hypothetical protein
MMQVVATHFPRLRVFVLGHVIKMLEWRFRRALPVFQFHERAQEIGPSVVQPRAPR